MEVRCDDSTGGLVARVEGKGFYEDQDLPLPVGFFPPNRLPSDFRSEPDM